MRRVKGLLKELKVSVTSKILVFLDNKHYLMSVALIGLLLLRYSVIVNDDEKISLIEQYIGKDVEVSGIIDDEPKEDVYTTTVTLGEVTIDGLSLDSIRLIAEVPRIQFHQYGDKCQFTGEIEIPENSPGFDYQAYLKRKGIYGVIKPTTIYCEASGLSGISALRRDLIDMRVKLVDLIEHSIPEPQSSLLAGILFGEERVFTEEFDNNLRLTGTTHIVAASGYNVMLLVNLVLHTLLIVPRRLRLLIALVVVWCFALFSGFSPSILRATVMVSTIMMMRFMGAPVNIGYAILLSLVVFLLWNPGMIWSVSFQLSLMATIGLIYISPIFNAERTESNFVQEYITTTIVATLVTAPVLIITFGEISLLGILSNVLILPILETTMVVGISAIGLSYFSLELSDYLFEIAFWQLKWFELVVNKLGSLEFGVITFEHPAVVGTVISLLLIAMFLGIPSGGTELRKINYYRRKALRWYAG